LVGTLKEGAFPDGKIWVDSVMSKPKMIADKIVCVSVFILENPEVLMRVIIDFIYKSMTLTVIILASMLNNG